MQIAVGQTLDRYVIDSELGVGGMAVVYRVTHADLGTRHALKVLQIAGRSLQERILQEGRIQARLRHPNVVAVTDVVRVAGAPGLVMELVEGPDLAALLHSYRPNLNQIDDLARGLLGGVAAAHAAGLIHRDLKPANVLLAVEGNRVVPKVTDFGLAKILFGGDPDQPRGRTLSGTTLGTPTFMAPEQFRDASKVDHRADVFSLGAILYELVTGVPAFLNDELIRVYAATSKEAFRPPRSLAPSIPRRFEDAIVGALRADPDARIPTVAALVETWCGADPAAPAAWEPEHLALLRSLAPTHAGPAPTSNATLDWSPDAEPEPEPEPAPAAAPPSQAWVPARRTALAWGTAGAVAALALATLALVAVVGAVVGAALDETTPSPAVADVAPRAPSGTVVVEEPPAPAPAPAPRVAVPEPAPAPAPRVAVPEPAPAVAAPAPPVVRVTPVPPPAPSGPVTRVDVTGVDRAFLLAADGTRHPPGTVPPGHYVLSVFFDAARPTAALELDVASGQKLHIQCSASMRVCR